MCIYIYIHIYVYVYTNPEPGLESFLIKKIFFSGGSVISHVDGIFLTLAALATIIYLIPKFKIKNSTAAAVEI